VQAGFFALIRRYYAGLYAIQRDRLRGREVPFMRFPEKLSTSPEAHGRSRPSFSRRAREAASAGDIPAISAPSESGGAQRDAPTRRKNRAAVDSFPNCPPGRRRSTEHVRNISDEQKSARGRADRDARPRDLKIQCAW